MAVPAWLTSVRRPLARNFRHHIMMMHYPHYLRMTIIILSSGLGARTCGSAKRPDEGEQGEDCSPPQRSSSRERGFERRRRRRSHASCRVSPMAASTTTSIRRSSSRKRPARFRSARRSGRSSRIGELDSRLRAARGLRGVCGRLSQAARAGRLPRRAAVRRVRLGHAAPGRAHARRLRQGAARLSRQICQRAAAQIEEAGGDPRRCDLCARGVVGASTLAYGVDESIKNWRRTYAPAFASA